MSVEYHPAVEAELREIQEYYDKQSSRARKTQFLDEFERQVVAVAATPQRWMVVVGDIRRCLMRRFPYITYFRCLADERIRITVVKHQGRHPGYGQARK